MAPAPYFPAHKPRWLRRWRLLLVFISLIALLPTYLKPLRRAWLRRRIPEWRDGRYHHHVASMGVGDPRYRQALQQLPQGWASASEMQVHCPATFNASLLPPDVLGLRLFVATNLRDNEGVMANFIHQIATLASLLPSPSEQLFVSVFESNSHDGTPHWVDELGLELKGLGVPHELQAGPTAAAGPGKRREHEDRIEFLARMRNQALRPLYQQDKGRRFDRVIFVNDVFFCAYEVLRLLMYDADLACGVDLYLEPEPYLDPPATAVRKQLTFYDLWVARDAKGQRFQWAPPFVKDTGGVGDVGEWRGEHVRAFPAYCCWDGMAVLRAEPFYRGLRFRSVGPGGGGVTSECTNMCTDLWANGYTKVIVDPQVKLAYDEPTYERLHARNPPLYLQRPDLLYDVDRRIPHPTQPPDTVSTCYLEPGPKKAAAMVHFDRCFDSHKPLAGAMHLDRLCLNNNNMKDEEEGIIASTGGGGGDQQVVPRRLLLLGPWDGEDQGQQNQCQGGGVEWSSGWKAMHVDYDVIHYRTRQEAASVLRRHLPLTVPLLHHLEGDWPVWRAMVSLALLWHHGGVLPVLPYSCAHPPRDSLECLLRYHRRPITAAAATTSLPDNTTSSSLLVLSSQTAKAQREADANMVVVVAAARHDPGIKAVLEEVFFNTPALDYLAAAGGGSSRNQQRLRQQQRQRRRQKKDGGRGGGEEEAADALEWLRRENGQALLVERIRRKAQDYGRDKEPEDKRKTKQKTYQLPPQPKL